MENKYVMDRAVSMGCNLFARQNELMVTFNQLLGDYSAINLDEVSFNRSKLRAIIGTGEALEDCLNEIEDFESYVNAWDWRDRQEAYQKIDKRLA